MEGVNPPYFLERRFQTMRGKKIIAIFLLIAVLLMPVVVFAGISYPDPPDDVWNYWVIIDKDGKAGGNYWLVGSRKPITMQSYGNKMFIDGIAQVYTLDKINGVWWRTSDITTGYIGISSMHKSNHDIAFDDGSGFFFRKIRDTLLFPATVTADFGMILRTISAGLIPLLGCLILGISFRKGWAFLRRQLTL